ncbi:hypothetical protein PORY_000012 [Pneumocystis oryctolagi]|uniref:Uncharacterized protein n=1 Tax=Pneumocystis oryctolagi TaxID=42067 RepID=A0ACB7CE44_9ASCO|nr:hypothetical protein PORY_000012 [Pneumocystis oryctolagi]
MLKHKENYLTAEKSDTLDPSAHANNSSAQDSGLLSQSTPHRRTHRRSPAVSLDWSLSQLTGILDKTSRPGPPVKPEVHCIENDVLKKEEPDNNKKQDIVQYSAVFIDKSPSKKYSRHSGRFLAESFSSFAHLYFGGLYRKKSSKGHVSVTPTVNQHVSSLASCSAVQEPLIDLDAALITKTNDSATSGTSRRHRRACSMSTVFSSCTCVSGNSFRKSCSCRGYPLKRRMSVIIEDTDAASSQVPSSPKDNPQGASVDEEDVQSIEKDKSSNIDKCVLQKENINLNDSECVSEKDNGFQSDTANALLLEGSKNVTGQDNIQKDQQNSVKNTKTKSRWRHLLKGLFVRKSD